jgi:exonuclease SbcC
MGDKYRANAKLLDEAETLVNDLKSKISALESLDDDLQNARSELSRLTAQKEQLEAQIAAWEQEGAPRLAEITRALEEETFAPEARAELAAVDTELQALGYDAAAHDAVRRTAADPVPEEDYRALESAQAALKPLDDEIANLQTQISGLQSSIAEQEVELQEIAAAYDEAKAAMPDLGQAQRELLSIREQENALRREVGAAEQKVAVLDDLRARRKSLEAEREELARRVAQFKQLEKAFGKDGVPALLIEQALPQIEAKANDILSRLTDGSMSVRFQTQRELKTRDDLKETLDITISDGAGTRDYEMFSGGEAFRVNFAIRLALSEVLAQRSGARLQTLVIDEGFGSQDALGRQRLIEAINAVRKDFAKILVITHIDALKDAFPTRIEVEKTPRGSVVSVVTV